MSSVCIMFSGGANSTFALWKWLAKTDHDITAIRGKIDSNAPGMVTEEEESGRGGQIVEWLQNNVRDFSFETVDFPPYEIEVGPIRAGFSATYNYGFLRPRYTGYAKVIATKNPDILVIGNSLENSTVDSYLKFRPLIENPDVRIFFAGSPNMEDEIPQGEDYDHAGVSASLIGKCQQISEMPEVLRPLCRNWNGEENNPRSINMLMAKAMDKWIEDGKEPAEFDQYCAKLGHYGKYLHLANPATAQWRSSDFNTDGYVENYLADIAGIPRYFKGLRDE